MTRSTRSPRASAPVAALDLTRGAVLAHRAHAQGLHREAATLHDLPGAVLGVQDSPPGAARQSLAARLTTSDAAAGWTDDQGLAVAWSVRGAPHVHRRADLPGLAAALWPHDDADAAARLAWNATRVAASGLPARQSIALAAAAVADVADTVPTGGELTKGMLSAEVTRRLPESLRRWCEPCGSTHVHEQLLRLATLPGGLAVTGAKPLTFGRVAGWPGVPAEPSGTAALTRAYLHLYGPAAPADVATFLGSTTATIRATWPDDAVPVRVDGRAAWALPEDVAALIDPPAAPDVRLLPPNDGFLKAGDRSVLVPDRAEQKVIWRVLGSPGVLLLDAVPAGVWRPKATGRRLELTVESFLPLDAGTRTAIDREATVLAAARGLTLTALHLP